MMTMTMNGDDGEQASEHGWLREGWTERGLCGGWNRL